MNFVLPTLNRRDAYSLNRERRFRQGAMIPHTHYRIRLFSPLVAAAAILLLAAPAPARSVFEGLELIGSERGGGVEIVNIQPSSPAARSMLRAGDRIIRIGNRRVRTLDDYVKVSRSLRDRKAEVTVEFVREGVTRKAVLSLYSSPLRSQWGVEVVPRRAEEAPGSTGDAEVWISEAKREIRGIERIPLRKRRPEQYGRAIQSLYTALAARPDSLEIASSIGKQYARLAALYYSRGERKKAAWCLRRALLIYRNALRRVRSTAELAMIKDDLEDLGSGIDAMRR